MIWGNWRVHMQVNNIIVNNNFDDRNRNRIILFMVWMSQIYAVSITLINADFEWGVIWMHIRRDSFFFLNSIWSANPGNSILLRIVTLNASFCFGSSLKRMNQLVNDLKLSRQCFICKAIYRISGGDWLPTIKLTSILSYQYQISS